MCSPILENGTIIAVTILMKDFAMKIKVDSSVRLCSTSESDMWTGREK